MATGERAKPEHEPLDPVLEALALIQEQGRLTLELVKSLVLLLTPREGGREGPTLEELLTRILMQQQLLITLGRETQADVQRIGLALPDAEAGQVNGHPPLRS